MKKWHVWNFPDNIRIYFKPALRKELYNKLIEICGTQAEIARKLNYSKTTIKRSLAVGKRKNRHNIQIESYISVKMIKRMISIFGHLLGKKFINKLEKNIIAYRAWNGWVVRNPKLPIIECPQLYSIVFHILADGNASKRHSPYYSNMSLHLIQSFINDLKIFGDIEVQLKYREDGLIYVKFPKAITDILSAILKVSFTKPKTLPKAVLNTSLKCKYAAIRAFIDDEGSVSNSIVVKQKSRKFLLDFKKLLNSVNIRCGKIWKDLNGVYCLCLWKESYNILAKIGLNHPIKSLKLIEALIKIKASHEIENSK